MEHALELCVETMGSHRVLYFAPCARELALATFTPSYSSEMRCSRCLETVVVDTDDIAFLKARLDKLRVRLRASPSNTEAVESVGTDMGTHMDMDVGTRERIRKHWQDSRQASLSVEQVSSDIGELEGALVRATAKRCWLPRLRRLLRYDFVGTWALPWDVAKQQPFCSVEHALHTECLYEQLCEQYERGHVHCTLCRAVPGRFSMDSAYRCSYGGALLEARPLAIEWASNSALSKLKLFVDSATVEGRRMAFEPPIVFVVPGDHVSLEQYPRQRTRERLHLATPPKHDVARELTPGTWAHGFLDFVWGDELVQAALYARALVVGTGALTSYGSACALGLVVSKYPHLLPRALELAALWKAARFMEELELVREFALTLPLEPLPFATWRPIPVLAFEQNGLTDALETGMQNLTLSEELEKKPLPLQHQSERIQFKDTCFDVNESEFGYFWRVLLDNGQHVALMARYRAPNLLFESIDTVFSGTKVARLEYAVEAVLEQEGAYVEHVFYACLEAASSFQFDDTTRKLQARVHEDLLHSHRVLERRRLLLEAQRASIINPWLFSVQECLAPRYHDSLYFTTPPDLSLKMDYSREQNALVCPHFPINYTFKVGTIISVSEALRWRIIGTRKHSTVLELELEQIDFICYETRCALFIAATFGLELRTDLRRLERALQYRERATRISCERDERVRQHFY
jgi:hypothetical protein